MIRRFIIFFGICLCFVVSSNFGPKYPPTRGEVWPKPFYKKTEDKFYNINPLAFDIYVTGKTCKTLTQAIERYSFFVREVQRVEKRLIKRVNRDLRPNHRIKMSLRRSPRNLTEQVSSLEVYVRNPCEDYPYFGMNESYSLYVSAPAVKLISPSLWGALRGLETFTQLFYVSEKEMEIRINKTEIHDAPRYPHRGLLIDTSRHYISLRNILKTIDAMSMNKMNVLHWHIIDDQSFPYQSEKFPDLSRLGAYHSSLVYTKENIKMIVNYARNRGIRVIPEIDVPGHTRSWGEAYPHLLSRCYQNGKFVDFGPLNPTINETYEMLRELFAEVQDWFPDKYFHIGGDEVDLSCWQTDPDIIKYMKKNNITSAEELHALFMAHALPLLNKKTTPIVWQEVFDEGVSLNKINKNTLIQVWKNEGVQETCVILNTGHQVLYSSSWYLDQLSNGGDWEKYYKADPRKMAHDACFGIGGNLDNIVGGEACMWGEVVDDNNIMSRVWPRASAVAEKLWSPEYRDTLDIPKEVYHRLEEHTCRMNRRGIRAQPPSGPGFCIGIL